MTSDKSHGSLLKLAARFRTRIIHTKYYSVHKCPKETNTLWLKGDLTWGVLGVKSVRAAYCTQVQKGGGGSLELSQ